MSHFNPTSNGGASSKIRLRMSPTSGQSTLSILGSVVRNSSRRWIASGQKKVSELMNMANKFYDGEDTYHSKRTRDPKMIDTIVTTTRSACHAITRDIVHTVK
jgi:hypothetical protein